MSVMRNASMSLDQEEHERQSIDHVIGLFTSDRFYFSLDFDLTNGVQRSFQKSQQNGPSVDMSILEDRFLFNRFLLEPFLSNETYPFILPVICGNPSMLLRSH